MGWEMRRRKPVYYRKEREGRRVRSVYCGSGERGERAAREDEERRRKQARAVAAPDVPTRAPAAPRPYAPDPRLSKLPRDQRSAYLWRARRNLEEAQARRVGAVLTRR